MKIKTIDIQAKEWFDRINGNSYFSAVTTLNYGMKSEKTIKIPFEYGYGSQYKFEAERMLTKAGYLPNISEMAGIGSLSEYCRENKIVLRTSMESNCNKSTVKEFGV